MTACVPDASRFIHVLEALLGGGHPVRFRAAGWSMYPTIRNGDAITVAPLGPSPVRVGDVLLYRRGAAAIAHRVIRVQSASGRSAGFVLCGDAAHSSDGPIEPPQVLGRVTAIERNGRTVHLDRMGPAWSRALGYTLRLTREARASVARIVDRMCQ
jgi:signal peptidase I